VRWPKIVATLVAAALSGLVGCSGDGPGSSEEAFCATASELAADNPAAAFGRFDPTDPAASQADLTRAVDQLRRLEEVAPGEVRAAASELADVAADLVEVLGELADDPEGVRDRLAAMQDRLVAVQDASRVVVEGVRTRCAVELDIAGPTVPPG
jgi:hypothetical protein